jgi:TPR repeat protein
MRTAIIKAFFLFNLLAIQPGMAQSELPDFIPLGDPKEAKNILQKAAERGSPQAQLTLGRDYLKGNGIERNIELGRSWIQKAAEQNYAGAQHFMGVLYWNGLGVERDYRKAFEWHLKAANQGHPESEDMVGFCYAYGTAIEQDYPKAVSWFLKSANHGNMLGQFHLASCYHMGYGVEKNTDAEISWFRKAAAQGHSDSLNILALKHYAKGEFDIAKAYAKKTADNENAVGQYILALSIMAGPEGKGSREAAQLLLRSAKQGNADAQLAAGEGYLHNGLGGVKDATEAVKWLTMAAEQGNAEALFWLGGCYATGEGTLKDEIEAYALLNLSGISYPKAKNGVRLLENLLPPDARIAGQQRSKQLQALIEKKRKERDGALDTLFQMIQEVEREKNRKGA